MLHLVALLAISATPLAHSEPATVDESPEATTAACPTSPHAHPPMLREDLAYSVTGRDCQGNLPSNYSVDIGLPVAARELKGRLPASSKEPTCANHKPTDHPLFLREDLAYSVLGEDCNGSSSGNNYGE